MPEGDQQEKLRQMQEFSAAEEARRQGLRSQFNDSWTRCIKCNWKERTSICIARGIKVCPTCGGNQCVREALDYDNTIAPNPLPTTQQQVKNIEQANQGLLRRYGGPDNASG